MQEVIIKIPDEAYATAEKLARQQGFGSTEVFLSDLLLSSIADDAENIERLFTPKVLAAIEKGAQEAREGKGMTRDEVGTYLAAKRTEWLENHHG